MMTMGDGMRITVDNQSSTVIEPDVLVKMEDALTAAVGGEFVGGVPWQMVILDLAVADSEGGPIEEVADVAGGEVGLVGAGISSAPLTAAEKNVPPTPATPEPGTVTS